MHSRILRPVIAALAATPLAIALTACGSATTASNPHLSVPGAISAVSSTDDQTGTVGQPLALPVTVRVVDQSNAPLPGAHIQWEPVSGAGTVDASTSTTDATGQASTHWTVGTTPGTDSLRVITTNGLSIYLIANVVAGPVALVNKTSGDAQTVPIGSSTFPLVVTVTDKYGNPIPGTTVRWAASAGTLTASSSTSDGKGQAQVVLTTVGPTAATYTVTATAGSASATFTITTR